MNKMAREGSFDLVGVGAGPSNLSLAALALGETAIQCRFLERKRNINWHRSLLFDGATMQTSCLEDLVTPVDPTNPLSFLAYLSDRGRIYQFLCTNTDRITRAEFEDYLQWAASRLPSIEFSASVREVSLEDGRLAVRTDSHTYLTSAMSVGIGTEPVRPVWGSSLPRATCIMAEEILGAAIDVSGRRVAVVGGGQTAAEIVLFLMSGKLGAFSAIDWISRRQNFLPLDDTPFVNELFTPQYVARFHAYSDSVKERLVQEQRIFADGISRETLRSLYQSLYQDTYVKGTKGGVRLFPCQEVFDARAGANSISLAARDAVTGAVSTFAADLVILCLGYQQRIPAFLEGLGSALNVAPSRRLPLKKDFRLAWDGPPGIDIFVQNGGRHSHGIADPQLCLLAWRSATILNAVLGRERYRVHQRPGFIRWAGEETGPVQMAAAGPIPASPITSKVNGSTSSARDGAFSPIEEAEQCRA